ncbi:MAG TPA: MASE1 domain-containing protein [Gemmatimonadales bacterium]
MPPAVRSTSRYAAAVTALAALYWAAAWIGLRYVTIGHSVSLVWPPAGIAFAALVLLGLRAWPGVTLGAFLANAMTPVPLAAAAGIALGNTGEAVLAALILRRVAGPRPQLEEPRQVRTLLFVAAPLGALAAALVGAASLRFTGALDSQSALRALPTWWAGDMLGLLVVAPVCFSWAARPRARDTRRVLEVVALVIGTALAADLGLLKSVYLPVLQEVEYTYLLFPFVVWAAVRFGPRGASLVTLAVAAVAVWHTVRGGGPFLAGSAGRTLFAVACYLLVLAVTGLLVASALWNERDRATHALQRSEERLHLALDAARMGIWYWSVDSNHLVWDDNLRALYGLSPEQPVGGYDEFLGRVHPDDRQFVSQSVGRALEQGGSLDYEFRILRPDGKVRWIADQGRVERDEHGRPRYLTGVCTDVTERRSAEERLRQSHRMESVGRLAGGVAHEANNQMSVVIGAADFILRRSDVPEAVRADVEHIRKAAERTSTVTAQLLAFSRRQVLRPEVLDLPSLVTKWESVLRRIMGEDSTVLIRARQDVAPVRADPGQLEQALLNLALNARDAMPRGGTLTVEVFSAELSDDYVARRPGVSIRTGRYSVLAVSDTGHGMDSTTLSHAFEPFFTTKGVGHGTGLGLSTVYGIVKQSDGYVWAYSEPGRGTTFKLYLPAVQQPVTSHSESPRPSKGPGRGELVLVVEDDEGVRWMTRRILVDAGYQVAEAPDGKAALELLARNGSAVRLVLTDVVIPGISGRELAEHIAQSRPDLPVVFTSGYTDGEILRRGLLDPGAAFVQKPFGPDTILQVVRERLESASLPAKPSPGSPPAHDSREPA